MTEVTEISDEVCSWGFNCGSGVFVTSKLVRKLNAGNYESVRSELARWDNAGSPPSRFLGSPAGGRPKASSSRKASTSSAAR